jgi:hypothetical protein
MKTATIAVLMVASLCVGQSNEAKLVRDIKTLFVDNIVDKSSGEDFAKAFAQEPTCSGLTLILWTSRSLNTDEQLNLWETMGWKLSYSNPTGSRHSSYTGGILTRIDAPAGLDSQHYSDFDIDAKTDRAAARQVCVIMKSKARK